MHRFFVPPEKWNPAQLLLDTGEAHHCADVLRLGPGDRVTAFDGRGSEATAEIVAASRHEVRLRTLTVSRSPRLPCAITLAQAIPKGRNMDLIIQKATELGAASIVPVLSERTVVRIPEDEAERKREKWQQIAVEAAKQCGQNWLPAIGKPSGIQTLLADADSFDLMLIASLQPDRTHLRQVLEEFRPDKGGHPPKSALILVGPEGDFTPAEMNAARAAGCRPITLGPIILRVETAAIYCLSILSYELLT